MKNSEMSKKRSMSVTRVTLLVFKPPPKLRPEELGWNLGGTSLYYGGLEVFPKPKGFSSPYPWRFSENNPSTVKSATFNPGLI